MEIQESSCTDTIIVFSVDFDPDRIELKPNARIILNIFEIKFEKNKDGKQEQQFDKLLNMVLKMPFRKSLKISELKPSKPYKFNFILENGQDVLQKNIFASTRISENPLLEIDDYLEDYAYSTNKTSSAKGLCQSEDILYKAALAHDVNKHVFKNEKEILKKVMDARKSQNTKEFINESYKFAKPNANKMERLKRTLMVAQGIELYENIYGYKEGNDYRNGFQFGQNDWFMGPFYSYDKNQQALKEEQIKRLMKDDSDLSSSQKSSNSTTKQTSSNMKSQQPGLQTQKSMHSTNKQQSQNIKSMQQRPSSAIIQNNNKSSTYSARMNK